MSQRNVVNLVCDRRAERTYDDVSIYLNVKERNEEAERIERDMARLQEFMANSNVPNGAIWAALLHNLANIKR